MDSVVHAAGGIHLGLLEAQVAMISGPVGTSGRRIARLKDTRVVEADTGT